MLYKQWQPQCPECYQPFGEVRDEALLVVKKHGRYVNGVYVPAPTSEFNRAYAPGPARLGRPYREIDATYFTHLRQFCRTGNVQTVAGRVYRYQLETLCDACERARQSEFQPSSDDWESLAHHQAILRREWAGEASFSQSLLLHLTSPCIPYGHLLGVVPLSCLSSALSRPQSQQPSQRRR